MIAKLQSISDNHSQNVSNYCEKGGELLYSHKCIGNGNQIYEQMKAHNSNNYKCKKQTFHAKIRIAPEDKGKLTTQDWIDISNKYSKKIGFHQNIFSVYIHEEATEKEHVHVVASRIGDDFLAVSNSFTHLKNLDFCREIENEYNLRKVKRKLEIIQKGEKFVTNDKRIQNLKEKIFKALDISDSIEDVAFYLKNDGIKMKIARGVTFIDNDGFCVKGSKIDRKLSLSGIKKLISYKNQFNSDQIIKPKNKTKQLWTRSR